MSIDIKKNPRPSPTSSQNFLICDWNSQKTAHSYVKISLLKAYVSVYKFKIICLSETYLDPSVPLRNVSLEIQGYEFDQSNHLSQHERGR